MPKWYVAMVCLCTMALGILVPGAACAQVNKSAPALKHSTVNMPWHELQTLLVKSSPVSDIPPVDFVFQSSTCDVDVSKGAVTAVFKGHVTTLRPDKAWVLVPVLNAQAGLVSLKVNDKPARLVNTKQYVAVLLPGKGEHTLAGVLKKKHQGSSLNGSASVDLMHSPLVNVTATIQGKGLDVNLGNNPVVGSEVNGKHTIEANTQGAQRITLSWVPTPPKVDPANRRIFSSVNTLLSMESRAMRGKARVDLEILHAPLSRLDLTLNGEVDVHSVTGASIERYALLTGDGAAEGLKTIKGLTLAFKRPLIGKQSVTVHYSQVVNKDAKRITGIPLVAVNDASRAKGSVALAVGSTYAVTPKVSAGTRVDVRDLPTSAWHNADLPLSYAWVYHDKPPTIDVGLTRFKEVPVLTAMADICEVGTTVTAEGRSMTKLMYVMRNNRKPFMSLNLPEGHQIWSVLVDDQPVVPAKAENGNVMIRLKKSQEVAPEDEDSYAAKRDDRRSSKSSRLTEMIYEDEGSRDLKPFDVEIVLVGPSIDIKPHGKLELALPKIDIPVGQLAWAVLLPKSTMLTHAEGSVKEVARFNLPFVHFVEHARGERLQDNSAAAQEMAEAMAEAADVQVSLQQAMLETGPQPVRINLPVLGNIFRFEKHLMLEELPKITIHYRQRPQ